MNEQKRLENARTDADWGKSLSLIRSVTKSSQKDFSRILKAAQSDISRWESGSKSLPDSVKAFVLQQEAELGLNATRPVAEREVHSSEFCYSGATFRKVWAESRKRIAKVNTQCTIRLNPERTKKSNAAEKFADIDMVVRFEGVMLPPNDPVYLDCLGVMPRLKSDNDGVTHYFNTAEGSDVSWVDGQVLTKSNVISQSGGTVSEKIETRKTLGPYAIGYQLNNIDIEDVVEVKIHGDRGVYAEGVEAIGMPVYADCPVESLSLSVTFEGLMPQKTPRAMVYILRRTLTDSRPIHLVGGLQVTSEENSHRYSIDHIRYPRPGYGFCIAWGGLEPS